MRIGKNSIVVKILLPSLLFITAVTVCLLFIAWHIVTDIIEDYHRLTIETHSREVQRVLDRAVTELVASNLLDEAVVLKAKRESVVREIFAYWKRHGLQGFITDPAGKVLHSTHATIPFGLLVPLMSQRDGFHFDNGTTHLEGHALAFPAWNWSVITLSSPKTIFSYRKQALLLIPLITVGSLLMMLGIAVVLDRNLRRPIRAITADITNGAEIGATGVAELDTIAAATNEAFRKLSKKTEQYLTLHNIAVSMNAFSSVEELLGMILKKAHQLIDAECAALMLFDGNGGVKRLVTTGDRPLACDPAALTKEIPDLGELGRQPLRINALGASDQPPRHLLSHPLLSDRGSALGAILFMNKAGGFTEDDETLLAAIAADAAVALNKAESLMQLKRFKEVIDSAFDVIVITNAEGAITYTNPAFETVTGYEAREVIGKSTALLNSGFHGEAFYREMWDAIAHGKIWKGEFINKKKSGDLYYTSAVIFPIRTDEGLSFASIQRDITQEKRLYEQLLRAQKMEAIGTLAGGIAHDFNNLLTAILGYAEIMLHTANEGDPYFKPASIVKSAAEKGAELARKILTISRKEKLETKVVDVNEIISSCMELLQRSIPKNIEIVLAAAEGLPLIKADPSQLQQVVMNLAVNARDAMPEGGTLTIETALVAAENGAATTQPEERGGFIKISVSDTGTGMDKDTQRKIFDPFFTTKGTGQGTGLGLYIVHSVISNHGGYVNLYSEPGKGTRFTLYLPITRERGEEHTEEEEIPRGSGVILVVDDDADVRELCRDMLEPLGYTVLLAASGREGISRFRENKEAVALVLLDMIMPGMGGNEVFQTLRGIDPALKIMLCSGYSHNGFAGIDSLLRSGARSFIQKPFTRLVLAKAIRQALGT